MKMIVDSQIVTWEKGGRRWAGGRRDRSKEDGGKRGEALKRLKARAIREGDGGWDGVRLTVG